MRFSTMTLEQKQTFDQYQEAIETQLIQLFPDKKGLSHKEMSAQSGQKARHVKKGVKIWGSVEHTNLVEAKLLRKGWTLGRKYWTHNELKLKADEPHEAIRQYNAAIYLGKIDDKKNAIQYLAKKGWMEAVSAGCYKRPHWNGKEGFCVLPWKDARRVQQKLDAQDCPNVPGP